MGGEYPKGGGGDIPGAFAPLGEGGDIPIGYSSPGAVFQGISPPFERRANLLGGQKSCDNGMGN